MNSRSKLSRCLLSVFLMLISSFGYAQDGFSEWLEALRIEAREAGISETAVNSALKQIVFVPEVIAFDRTQPEFVSPFLDYYQKRVNPQKVQKGQQMLAEHAALLNRIEKQYGVSKYVLVAFWGMETQYGRNLGKLDVLSSLATLAYDGRRTEFFRAQLLDAMRMIEHGHVSATHFKGSWAGAFGNMQFMPTTFMLYAVDGDNDNKIDVINSIADAFASAANYLSTIGWRHQEPAMLEVQLPETFDWQTAQLNFRKPLHAWAQSGVRKLQIDDTMPSFQQLVLTNKSTKKIAKKPARPVQSAQFSQTAVIAKASSLEDKGMRMNRHAAILLPQGYRGPAFMVLDNFDAMMDWNRSVNYALSVALLAEHLRQPTAIIGGQYAEDGALSYGEMYDLQTMLNSKGFDAGEPDGLPGFKTQQALRLYQLMHQLPADGYASRSIYLRISAERLQKP